MKKKQIIKRIILGITVFSFVLSFSQSILPSQANAAALNWTNPNANGDNPYKLTTDAMLNPKMLMQVVGCTGIVDKVSKATMDFLFKKTRDEIKKKALQKEKEIAAAACNAAKGTAKGASAAIPLAAGTGPQAPAVQTAIDSIAPCSLPILTMDMDALIAQEDAQATLEADKKRTECFNGLAYTLAKNQLTSMTRETVNWINTGFNGNPMYVQNITSLTSSMEKNVIDTGIGYFANRAFPYSDTFAKTAIRNYNTHGIINSPVSFFDSLTSDLGFFVTDTKSYTNTNFAQTTANVRERSLEATNAFSNDFSTGGWDAWTALTQRDQNNPLGFTMMASQIVADRIDQQANETKDELTQNNGFLNQKECTLWQLFDNKGNALTTDTSTNILANGEMDLDVYAANKSNTNPNFDKCVKWKTTTPGSIVKDKLSAYMGSPERQLEMADTINEGLSSLFTALIENFRSEGLFGLSQDPYLSGNSGQGGYGVNVVDINNSLAYSPDYSSSSNNSSGYDSDFDLTRDLGNTYIHSDTSSLGDWDAKNNSPELNINLGPSYEVTDENGNKKLISYPAGYYYNVTNTGNTKLFNNGYSGWEKGDRAFWNGKEWQDWKCGLPLKDVKDPLTGKIIKECPNQTSPINARGIIQIQSDYIVAAKEILKVLPGVMPKIGELDYCIPGPNPSWETQAQEAGILFTDYKNTLSTVYTPGEFFVKNSTDYKVAQSGTDAYDNYKKLFDDLSNNTSDFFDKIQNSEIWQSILGYTGKSVSNNISEKVKSQTVDQFLTTIDNSIKTFLTYYKTSVFEAVYSPMESEYNYKETSSNPIKNPAYLPMLNDGYSITKNMPARAEDIAGAEEEYKKSIVEAEANIGKLNLIRSEVSKIITAAQGRRDALLLADLRKKPEYDNLSDIAAKAKYLNDYKECFDEENISYYNANDIMVNTESETGRCNDGLDNDLDGLIDAKDPDCASVTTNGTTPSISNSTDPTRTVYGCIINRKKRPLPVTEGDQPTTNCLLRTQQDCLSSDYISQGDNLVYQCTIDTSFKTN